MGRPWGPDPEDYGPRAELSASVLELPALRAHRLCNQGGHGAIERVVPYSVAEMAIDTAQLIEALGLLPCRVVRYSLGGQIAEELCYRHPKHVNELVLLASAGRSTAFLRLHVRAQVDLATALDPPLPSQVARDRLLFTQPSSVLQDDDDTVELVRSTMKASPPWTNPGRFGQWAAVAEWINDEQRTERWPLLTQRCLLTLLSMTLRSRRHASGKPPRRCQTHAS
jgi:pimeloyl-ACP methyl ester carboxylesterase